MIISNTDLNNNEKLGYVYRHIRLDTNMPFYIGIGTMDGGKNDRANSRDRSKEWHTVVNNTEYRVDILLENIPVSTLGDKEKYFIKLYGRIDLGTGTLVNKTSGGQGSSGALVSEETKDKRSYTNMSRFGVDCPLLCVDVAKKTRETNLIRYGVEDVRSSDYVKEKRKKTIFNRYGVETEIGWKHISEKRKKTALEKYGVENTAQYENFKEKQKQTNLERYGVICGFQSEEVKNKSKNTCFIKYGVDHQSKTEDAKKLRRELTAPYSKKVGQYKDNELIKDYPSISSVELDGYSKNCVSMCCNGRSKSHKGYNWRFLDNTELPSQNKKVGQYKDDVLIKEYPSIKSVEIDGFTSSGVGACCNGRLKTYKGFQWRFV